MSRRAQIVLALILLIVGLIGLARAAVLSPIGLPFAVCGVKSVLKFLPYQNRWINDKSRFKVVLKCRQSGYSWATCYEVVEDCIKHKGASWYYLSTNEARAKDAIETMQRFAEAFRIAATFTVENYRVDDFEYKALVLTFPGGSKITGLPANPHTARGVHGNLVLDEFAHHKGDREIWAAVSPVITRGYRVIVISTPAGKRGKFYEIWEHGKGWSRHRIDIYDAVKEGLQTDIDELRDFVGDPDVWAQEYECAFLDEAHAWIPYDLIDAAEDEAAGPIKLDEGAGRVLAPDFRAEGTLFLGYDVGRKRDLAVAYLDDKVGDVHWCRLMLILDRQKFARQREVLYELIPLCRRSCIDSTGLGMQLAEEAVDKFGGARVEAVTFNLETKSRMATFLKPIYEDRRIRMPRDRDLREDIHSIRKIAAPTGHFRFDAERSELGHADRFWAQALAASASDAAVEPFAYKSLGKLRSAGLMGVSGSGRPPGPFPASARRTPAPRGVA